MDRGAWGLQSTGSHRVRNNQVHTDAALSCSNYCFLSCDWAQPDRELVSGMVPWSKNGTGVAASFSLSSVLSSLPTGTGCSQGTGCSDIKVKLSVVECNEVPTEARLGNPAVCPTWPYGSSNDYINCDVWWTLLNVLAGSQGEKDKPGPTNFQREAQYENQSVPMIALEKDLLFLKIKHTFQINSNSCQVSQKLYPWLVKKTAF